MTGHSWSSAGIAILIGLLLGLRVATVALSPHGPSGDSAAYVNIARELYERPHLPPIGPYSPGFPLLLWPIYAVAGEETPTVVRILNILADFSVVTTLLLIARRVFSQNGSPAPRYLAYIGIASQPFTGVNSHSSYSEPIVGGLLFFGVLSLAAGWAARRGWSTVVASGLLSLACWIRLELVPVVMCLLALTWGLPSLHRLRLDLPAIPWTQTAVPFLLLVGIPAGYYLWNHEELIRRTTGQEPGVSRWLTTIFVDYHAFERLAWHHPDRFRSSPPIPEHAFDSPAEKENAYALIRRIPPRRHAIRVPDEVDHGFMELAETRIREHPIRHLIGLPMLRMLHYWANLSETQFYLGTWSLPWRSVRWLPWAAVGSMKLLAVTGAGIAFWSTWIARAPSWSSFARSAGVLASVLVILRTISLGALGTCTRGGLMEPRYVAIVYPALLLLAILGWDWACGSRRRRR